MSGSGLLGRGGESIFELPPGGDGAVIGIRTSPSGEEVGGDTFSLFEGDDFFGGGVCVTCESSLLGEVELESSTKGLDFRSVRDLDLRGEPPEPPLILRFVG